MERSDTPRAVTPEAVEAHITDRMDEKSLNSLFWVLRECSICKRDLGYVFRREGFESPVTASWSSACDCATYESEPEARAWGEVAYFINMQTHKSVMDEHDQFLHLDQFGPFA